MDPAAAHNLASDFKAIADTAASQVAEFYEKTKGKAVERQKLDLQQSESLHALGYMSSDSAVASDTDNEGGADPKQKIGIANLLYRGAG